jgi:hypothetical protein
MTTVLRTLAPSFLAILAAAILLIQPGREAAAQPPVTLPTDLALVPTNAAGFLHLHAAELWKNESLAGFRTTFEKAGPKALAFLDKQFVPKPSTFDRVTAFVLIEEGNEEQPIPYGILTFSEPFDSAEVVKAYLPQAVSEKVNGKTIYHGQSPFEMYFPDSKHIVISPPGQLGKYLKHQSPKTGPLSSGLKLAATGKPVVLSLNMAALPFLAKELAGLPNEVKPLLKAEQLTLSLDLAAKVRLEFAAGYQSGAEAEAAEKSIRFLAEMGRKELAKQREELEKNLFDPKRMTPRPAEELPTTLVEVFGLGAMNQLDDVLANPGALIKRSGSNLTAGFDVPKESFTVIGGMAMSVGLMIPAVQKVRSAAARHASQNNIKQILLACHCYHDAYGVLPHDITDKNGKPILSWRVAILPFLEQQALYNQFKLDEPWDSEHNKKWSEMAVKVYMSPQANPPTPPGMTQYKGFAGPGTVFELGKKLKLADITDGTSNTILIVEAGEPIPWAKPGDIPFDPKKPLPKLALPGVPDIVNFGMCDGSVRTANMNTLTEKTLRNLITRDDGNVIGSDW